MSLQRVVRDRERGLRGESQADILRRTGMYGVLLTDSDAQAMAKLNGIVQTVLDGTIVAINAARDQTVQARDATIVNAQLAASAEQAVLDNIDSIDVQAGLTLQATSRTAMAAITTRPEGRQVKLSEDGRVGTFVWNGADASALIAADPYQGLYVAPASDPTGASGAWRRLVDDGVYLARWWGISATQGADNHLRFISALDPLLTPAGSTILFKWKVPVFRPILRKRDDITIEGAGVTSWLYPTDDIVPLQLIGNNLTLRNFRCDSRGPMQHANANMAVLLGLDTTLTVYSNWLVDGVTCRGTGHGVLVTASSVATLEADVSDDETKIARPTNIEIRNCDIVVSQQAVSVFGCKGVIVRDNILRSVADNYVDGYKLCGRTLGSEDVLWIDNKGSTNGDYAFRLDQMGRGLPNAAKNAEHVAYMNNRNVAWVNNRVTGAELGAFYLGPCRGTCEIAGNVVFGNIAGTEARVAVQHPNSVDPLRPLVVSDMETLIVRDNRFEGYASGFVSNATEKRVTLSNNYFLGNGSTAAYPNMVTVYWEFSQFAFAEVVNNQFLMGNQQVGVRATGAATGKLRVTGNTFPEGMGPSQVQLSSGNFDERTNGGFPVDPTKPGYHANDNGIYAPGTFAAAIA